MGMEEFMFLPLLLPLLLHLLLASADSQAMPGCPTKCGEVEIPYPFGIRDGCSRDKTFLLNCNSTHYSPAKPFWDDMEILKVSVIQGQVVVTPNVSSGCFDKSDQTINLTTVPIDLSGSPFSFSDRNMFTVTGCATVGYITDSTAHKFQAACASICTYTSSINSDTCLGGGGCCQTSLPKGLKYFHVDFDTYYNRTGAWQYNPCSFAFLVEQNGFHFNTSFLKATDAQMMKLPVVLDWAMENQTCQGSAENNKTAYTCRSKNNICLSSPNGLGSLCNCSSGYQGNPYLENGCRGGNGICTNTQGSFICSCPEGTCGNSTTTFGCIPIPKSKLITAIVAGVGGGLGLLLFTGSSTLFYKRSRKRMENNLTQRMLLM